MTLETQRLCLWVAAAIFTILAAVCGLFANVVNQKIAGQKDASLSAQPIRVVPATFTVSLGGDWSQERILDIHNRSSDTVYNVWVKIAVSAAATAGSLRWEVFSEDGRGFVFDGDAFKEFDVWLWRFSGNGRPGFMLIFWSLKPNELRRFKVRIIGAPDQPTTKVKLVAELVRFDKEPSGTMTSLKEPAAAVSFLAPSGFEFSSSPMALARPKKQGQ